MNRKIQSDNGLYAIIEEGQLMLVSHDEKGDDAFFSDSDKWLYELYKILKRVDQYGCFNKYKNSMDESYEVEKV